MAIEGTKTTLELTSQRRTRVIVIEIPYGEAPRLTAHREIVSRDPEGKVVMRENAPEITRDYLAVAGESFKCADGSEVSIPHVSETLAGLIDRWETEDRGSEAD